MHPQICIFVPGNILHNTAPDSDLFDFQLTRWAGLGRGAGRRERAPLSAWSAPLPEAWLAPPESRPSLDVKCVVAGSVLINAPEGELEGWLSGGTAPVLPLRAKW